MNKHFYILSVFVLLAACTTAQEALYPVNFSTFFLEESLHNPALQGYSGTPSIGGGHQSFPRIGSDISSFYFTGQYTKRTSNRKQSIGGLLIGEKEGPILNNVRGYLSYSIHIPIDSTQFLSLGAQLGLYNFNIKANQFTGGSSSIAPDGNIGISYYNDDFTIGVSIPQIFNSNVVPFSTTFKLARYLNVYTRKRFNLQKNEIHTGLLLINMLSSRSQLNVFGYIIFLKNIQAGLNYQYQKSIDLHVGITNFPLRTLKDQLTVLVVYEIPQKSHIFSDLSVLQVSLSYKINTKGYFR